MHITALRFAFGREIEAQIFYLTTNFNMENETTINHQTPPDAKRMLADGASTYWVIEGLLNGQIIYWTGNIPNVSIQQSEAGLTMWTPNIHEANKMKSKDIAENCNEQFNIQGEVAEHMDV